MSTMSERLLGTLDAIQARDEVATEVLEKARPQPGVDFDKDTGEWFGEPPEGYQPVAMPPSLEDIKSKESKVPDFDDTDATTDYKRIRDTTYAMQEATMFMMGQAAKLAATTEAPRAFSVFRELGELMRGLNKDLMENQKTIKSVTGDKEPPGETEVEVVSDGDTTTVTVNKRPQSSRDLLKTIEEARARAEARAAEEAKKKRDAEAIDVEPNEDAENGVSEA